MLPPTIRSALVAAFLLVGASLASAAGEFRNCGQTNFCYRNRNMAPTSYAVTKVQHAPNVVYLDILQKDAPADLGTTPLKAKIQLMGLGTVNFFVEEDTSVTDVRGKRYDAARDVKSDTAPLPDFLDVKSTEYGIRTCSQTYPDHCVMIHTAKFRLIHELDGRIISEVNSQNLFNFEQHRDRLPRDTAEMWKETWDGWTDTKRRGPASLSLDVTFPHAAALYGLPEHTTGLALKTTRGPNAAYGEPYRLYNLDAYGHPLDSPGPVYGSVPFIMAHGSDGKIPVTGGAFFLNPSEMFIDVSENEGGKGHSTHWMVETGLMNVYLFAGYSPMQITQQYMAITGLPVMPPLFSMAYHQCRWNYDSQDDVLDVNAGFEEHKIAYDVIWLDIDHTDKMKYFTWDPTDFSDPIRMQKSLAKSGRHLVNIVDPHIKVDNDYSVYKTLSELDYFVHDGADNVFEGDCWPGRSSWADFVRPEVREQWAKFFSLDYYNGSTTYLHIWNDMNEPSVFTGPEKTLPKDTLHARGSIEHRDIHNLYGYLYNLASSMGLYRRQINVVGIPDKIVPAAAPKNAYSVTPVPGAAVQAQRPFLLTRSFFSGTQRIGAVWTGDNQASWGYLKYSHRMLMNLGIGGITFAGADIGGFAGNPSVELVERWYQSAAFVPFFRAHSSNDTARREPWMYGEPATSRIRDAIRRRYDHLAYVNTQFRIANTTGIQPLRPLVYEFPTDPETFKYDDSYLMGGSMMIVPVTEPGQTSVQAYLPIEPTGERSVWYDSRSRQKVSYRKAAAEPEEECPMARAAREAAGVPAPAPAANKEGYVTLDAPPEYSPVLYRGGRVIPTQPTLPGQDRPHLSSSAMSTAPFDLVVAMNDKLFATGNLYIDDGSSYDFIAGNYVYMSYLNKATGDAVEPKGFKFTADRRNPMPSIVPMAESHPTAFAANLVHSIVVLGVPTFDRVVGATLTAGQVSFDVAITHDSRTKSVVFTIPPEKNIFASTEFVLEARFAGNDAEVAEEAKEEQDVFAAAIKAVEGSAAAVAATKAPAAGGLLRRLGLVN